MKLRLLLFCKILQLIPQKRCY